MYQEVLSFATKKHENQIRKFNGEPYINHPIRVATIVREFTTDPDIIAAALLHDTLEDTDTTFNEIKEQFNDYIAHLVLELTSDKDQIKLIGKTKYLLEKMNHLSNDALLVKLADRLDNISDLSHEHLKWSLEYSIQTDNIMTMLDNTNMRDHHMILINRIKKKTS